MRIVFDIMGTVLGTSDHSPRPGIREAIEALRACGADISFWEKSDTGRLSALLRGHGIDGRVYMKDSKFASGFDLCVDDEPEEWIPGRVYVVDPHVSRLLPGSAILAAELFNINDSGSFFWD